MVFSVLRSRRRRKAKSLYAAVMAASRSPMLYRELAIADNPNGRFESLALHVSLVIWRLRQLGPTGDSLAGELLEEMFDGLDRALREMGVGDLSVPKKMKALASNYFGRAMAYERCLTLDAQDELERVLLRNVYSGEAPKAAVAALSRYCRKFVDDLEALTLDSLLAGKWITDFSENAHER